MKHDDHRRDKLVFSQNVLVAFIMIYHHVAFLMKQIFALIVAKK